MKTGSRVLLAATAAAVAVLALGGPATAAEFPPPTPLLADQASGLEEALERYREIERRGGWGVFRSELPMGAPFSYDCRLIAALEKRLILEGYLDHRSSPPPPPPLADAKRKPSAKAPPPPPPLCRYGPELVAAVSAFQADRYVLGDGQVGGLTKVELNRPVEELVDLLERDVARWRSVSLERSGTYLLVNIPFFELVAFEHGRETLRMPVVTGQKTWQTPQFRAEVQYMILNPDWGIPEKIAKQEYLPQARRDPKYLGRIGITSTGGSLRQKPGPRNPLGRIKFVMPNPNDVYLHDTPEKGAFKAASRALSHGCVRLSRPLDLAAYLLRDQPQWSAERVESAIATKRTQQINLREEIPVHIVYSTTRVNEAGRVEFRRDVYEKNGKRVEIPREDIPGLEATDTGP